MAVKLQEVFGVSKQRVLSYLEREAVDGFFGEGARLRQADHRLRILQARQNIARRQTLAI